MNESTKVWILEKVRELRLEIEQDGMSEEQACLLTDVCSVLGCDDAETSYVVGPAFTAFVNAPIPYRLTPDERQAFALAFALGPEERDELTLSGPNNK